MVERGVGGTVVEEAVVSTPRTFAVTANDVAAGNTIYRGQTRSGQRVVERRVGRAVVEKAVRNARSVEEIANNVAAGNTSGTCSFWPRQGVVEGRVGDGKSGCRAGY